MESDTNNADALRKMPSQNLHSIFMNSTKIRSDLIFHSRGVSDAGCPIQSHRHIRRQFVRQNSDTKFTAVFSQDRLNSEIGHPTGWLKTPEMTLQYMAYILISLALLLVQITPLADLSRVSLDLFFNSFHYHITQFHCCNVSIAIRKTKQNWTKRYQFLSCPAFSCPAIWSVIFMSVIFSAPIQRYPKQPIRALKSLSPPCICAHIRSPQ